MKSCFFIGHREADERLRPTLINTIERLVDSEGVTCFYVGGYGGFDCIAASAVKRVKKSHPEILLMRVLSYHPAEHPVETPYTLDARLIGQTISAVLVDSNGRVRIKLKNRQVIERGE